ncbi:HD domain-containing protein [Acidianus ambivalens]|uniref:HD domain-containing protein n=1 Tax=Acidianus ambivalens TaxID=2283 RepID=A0A650CWT9_ACIAM|nr:HD domain-containing protein [Acidianus ambivalens]MQL54274.1 HD domain-containing protein [Acidianus ambivalens]QGR22102.1 HD domain-containing protein [Acidianus ambivalens]
MNYYIRIDPLTLYGRNKVTDSIRENTKNLLVNIIRSINSTDCKQDIKKCGNFLNKVADRIVDEINEEWERYYFNSVFGTSAQKDEELGLVNTPADTRFPGFVNSLADHMLTTSAFAVAAALSYYDNKCGELKAYDIDFSDRELLRGFVRVAALLHDIGKPPPVGHTQRTKEIVYALFKDINERLANALSEASSRHHYGYKYTNKPQNFIEWIISYADKASASSRTFLPRNREVFEKFLDFAEKLQDLYDIGGKDYINEIKNKVVENDEDSEELRTYGFLSDNENKAIDLALKLRNAENELCSGKKLLALYHFEIPSIKSYLNRGRELSVYAGYSIMIDSLIHDVSDYIKSKIGKEAVISDEGGSLLAIIPSSFNSGELIKSLDLSPFDTYKENKMEFKFAEAHLGPEENWKGWGSTDPYLRDSLRGFGSLINKFLSSPGVIKSSSSVNLQNKSTIPVDKICKKCRINYADDGDECESCKTAEKFYKTFVSMVKGKNSDTEISGKIKRLRIYKLIEELNKRNERKISIRVWDTVDDLNKDFSGEEVDLKKRRFPTIIVGDGDNFGQLKSTATTLTQYLEINRFFTYMIYYSILYALENTALNFYKHFEVPVIEFQPILLGGDDFSLLLTSQELVPFLYYVDEALVRIGGRICRNLKSEYKDIAEMISSKKPYQWFGISVGAYIYKNTSFPIFLAREMAEELEHVSKTVSKKVFQDQFFGTGVISTIMDEKSFGLLERIKNNKGICVLGSDMKEIYDTIARFENAGISSRKIFDYIKLEGDRIRIFYDVARNNSDSLETVMKTINDVIKRGYDIQGYLVLLGTLMSSLEQKNFDGQEYYRVPWNPNGDPT